MALFQKIVDNFTFQPPREAGYAVGSFPGELCVLGSPARSRRSQSDSKVDTAQRTTTELEQEVSSSGAAVGSIEVSADSDGGGGSRTEAINREKEIKKGTSTAAWEPLLNMLQRQRGDGEGNSRVNDNSRGDGGGADKDEQQMGSAEELAVPCLVLPAPSGKATHVLLYLHGTSTDLGGCRGYLEKVGEILGVHVCAVEYPGYGVSGGGSGGGSRRKDEPSQRKVNRAVEHVLRYITEDLEWGYDRVIVMGNSVGTGPAVHIAVHDELKSAVAAVVLIAPFTSIRDIAATKVGTTMASYIAEKTWDNLTLIHKIQCPLLLLHGNADKIINHSHSHQLYEACCNGSGLDLKEQEQSSLERSGKKGRQNPSSPRLDILDGWGHDVKDWPYLLKEHILPFLQNTVFDCPRLCISGSALGDGQSHGGSGSGSKKCNGNSSAGMKFDARGNEGSGRSIYDVDDDEDDEDEQEDVRGSGASIPSTMSGASGGGGGDGSQPVEKRPPLMRKLSARPFEMPLSCITALARMDSGIIAEEIVKRAMEKSPNTFRR